MPLLSKIAGRALRLPQPATREVRLDRNLPVAMADGTVLLADRYAPPGTRATPTVLVRSPYGRAGVFGFLFGRVLAERGLHARVQSIRGTFGSGGSFDPFNERGDGLATLRWLRAQPWHDGPVGTLPGLYHQLPLAELDERAFGGPVAYFREWMEQMAPDSPYWATRDFSSSVGAVEANVQLTGGWYDIFLPWMVEDLRARRCGWSCGRPPTASPAGTRPRPGLQRRPPALGAQPRHG